MIRKDENGIPLPRKNGWVYIFIAFAFLALVGLTLSLLYRDMPKQGDIIAREKTKRAKHVRYAIVFSRVSSADADSVIARIRADVGSDSNTTDLIVGSPVVDPWSASMSEYERNLRRAMSEANYLDVGKQTQIVSMVAGLLVKSHLPATIYFIGKLNPVESVNFVSRTQGTVAGIDLRNSSFGPVSTVFFLRPAADTTNIRYVSLFKGRTFSVETK
ncbi:MAG: hypothetical protein HYX66_04580 [Ignavibacteria bacterium]|nr:hypothetical protein [Ignavibacteria bacterium]